MNAPLRGEPDRQLSDLFSAIVDWSASLGAKNIGALPGLWCGTTKHAAGIGPLEVKINGHSETIEAVPPIHAAILTGGILPVAMLSPYGGMILLSPKAGEDEDALIRHFREQPEPSEDDLDGPDEGPAVQYTADEEMAFIAEAERREMYALEDYEEDE